MNERQVVVLSGGLDSSTLLKYVSTENPQDGIFCISFDYGQRHAKELLYATEQFLQTPNASDHKIIDVSFLSDLFAESGSSLVTGSDVPEGHYGEESMKATVVPNRNMIMASIAAGYAISIEAESLWLGVHAGDHYIYPDCRPEFFSPLNAAIVRGNAGFGTIEKWNEDPAVIPQEFVRTPFIHYSKNAIALVAAQLGVDIANTWSCYKGGEKHCGKCGTCVERLEAINEAVEAGLLREDPTEYEDNEFWREALKRETV